VKASPNKDQIGLQLNAAEVDRSPGLLEYNFDDDNAEDVPHHGEKSMAQNQAEEDADKDSLLPAGGAPVAADSPSKACLQRNDSEDVQEDTSEESDDDICDSAVEVGGDPAVETDDQVIKDEAVQEAVEVDGGAANATEDQVSGDEAVLEAVEVGDGAAEETNDQVRRAEAVQEAGESRLGAAPDPPEEKKKGSSSS
jgi:hypothetical protein